MRKNVFGRQFKRDTNERKALFKSLVSSLILTGRIKTTEAKAKAIRGDVDKIITKAKKGEVARRILQSYLLKDAVEKALSEIAPRFAKRQGGYARIIRIGRRLSDKASMVLMEWAIGPKPKVVETKPIEAGSVSVANKRKSHKEVKDRIANSKL